MRPFQPCVTFCVPTRYLHLIINFFCQQQCQIPNSSSTSKVASYAANNSNNIQRDARQRYSGCIESANLDKIETICEAAAGGERAR